MSSLTTTFGKIMKIRSQKQLGRARHFIEQLAVISLGFVHRYINSPMKTKVKFSFLQTYNYKAVTLKNILQHKIQITDLCTLNSLEKKSDFT